MTFLLAWKNTRLHFRKRLPIALFLIVAMALMFLGNSVFSNTDAGLSQTYRNSLSGDLTVSATSQDGFTLFGSELPLIGEYFKNPTLPSYDDVLYRVSRELPTAQVLPVLIGAGELSLGKFKSVAPFFGARLEDYMNFFPGLKIVEGTPPKPGRPGLFLNSRVFAAVTKALKREPKIGELFLFAAALDNSFVLREVPFEGVFSYPVSDQLLDRVVLIDDDTARALNGYYGSSAVVSDGEADLLAKDNLDDLFSDSTDLVSEPVGGLTIEGVNEELKSGRGDGPTIDQTTWNFLLLKDETLNLGTGQERLQSALDQDRLSVQVRNWRDSAGGNARIVWFLQWIFNAGLVFVSLVASLIVMNSLSLSVAERTREIGTMRALGSPRSQIAQLIGYETLVLVTGSGLIGIFFGTGLLFVAGFLGGIPLDNPLLASLFGSHKYIPVVSWVLVGWHCVLGLGLGLLSMVVPILRALKVTPVQAMARE